MCLSTLWSGHTLKGYAKVAYLSMLDAQWTIDLLLIQNRGNAYYNLQL